MFPNLLSCLFGISMVAFKNQQIVPDLIDTVPKDLIQIKYPSGVSVQLGNELTPTQVKDEPTVYWPTEVGALYTLAMIDVDAPSRANHTWRGVKHWLAVNTPHTNTKFAYTLADYMGSGPPKGSGLHRYVFLAYKQAHRIGGMDPDNDNRLNFDINAFAKQYDLGQPIAGNFFVAQWDQSVED
ncbi:unnamed protein product [Oppiella nova]|uniref:Phosphatidylethanolamine-binding protein n=1 Tax=Oppiella nova TaxID=334625 RepID=A0A7R9MHW3_9ACAR|nr:unnamed protein product [Oppiella nova]CAG2177251.1 unnamed protein product [Oppiella nova]